MTMNCAHCADTGIVIGMDADGWANVETCSRCEQPAPSLIRAMEPSPAMRSTAAEYYERMLELTECLGRLTTAQRLVYAAIRRYTNLVIDHRATLPGGVRIEMRLQEMLMELAMVKTLLGEVEA